MSTELETKVTEVVAETILASSGREVDLTPETELLISGYLDSLTLLQLLVVLQDTFEVDLDVDDLTEDAFSTPKSIATLVEDRSS